MPKVQGAHLVQIYAGGDSERAALASVLILKREGLGWGDVKLAAAAGLLLGWQKLIFAVLVASVSASIILLTLRALRRDGKDHEYPFAPFLAFGFTLAMLVGSPVINWYAGLILG